MGMSERLELIARNVADIAATPWEVLGDGPARFLLMEMAYAGLDIRICLDCTAIWRVYLGEQQMTCRDRAVKFAV
jgi:hypothetical protein